MESCLRGFSFIPDQKLDVKLEYIGGEELERTWKSSRRQRLKEREQRIWDEFVQEQDVISTVCKDDPYLFLERLPEACLKELMEIELQKMKRETDSKNQVQVQEQRGECDSPCRSEEAPQPTVMFAEDVDGGGDNVIHIIDDKDIEQSDGDDDSLNKSASSTSTVREKDDEGAASPLPTHGADNPETEVVSCKSHKSSENVSNMIESSIYGAKVRDLRKKINDEILAIISSLERVDIPDIEPEELAKMRRRSGEFCARFHRVHLYQLQRQIQDVKRTSNASLPYARHTQFQSHMVRVASLHQNLLQALQVFRKSVPVSVACVAGVAGALHGLSAASRALHAEEILTTCDRLDEAINEFTTKTASYIESTTNTVTPHSKKSKNNKVKKSLATWTKPGSKTKSVAQSRLSMYSLDSHRNNLHPKSLDSKDLQLSGDAGGRRGRAAPSHAGPKPKPTKPPSGRRRAASGLCEVPTAVETIGACLSSRVSCEPSPHREPAPISPGKTLKTKNDIKADHQVESSQVQQNPVSTIRCSRRDNTPRSVPEERARNANDSPKPSPRCLEENEMAVERNKIISEGPGDRCEVTRIVRQLCGGDAVGNKHERVSGAKNAQLFCISGSSPRQPSTPQLLKILEETIQKKSPKALHQKTSPEKNPERFRLTFSIPDRTSENLFQYRTRFVQHMLSSPMYANSLVGKPWEMISSVSDRLIDDLLLQCAKEMELRETVHKLYQMEIR